MKLVLAGVAIAVLGLAAFAGYKWLTPPRGFDPQNMRITKLTDSGRVSDVAISPDGRYIVYVQKDGEQYSMWVRNVATKSDVQVLPPEPVRLWGVSFSPDGNYIYFLRDDKRTMNLRYLYVIPVLGGIPRQLIRDVDSAVSFSPDGKQFVFARGVPERGVFEVRIANEDGSGDHLLASLPAETQGIGGHDVAWSPNGKTILVPFARNDKEGAFGVDAINVADGGVKEMFSSRQGCPTAILS
jgi:Tol biopolymer transport system component